ncbi:MAG: type II secretion system protein, partial [Acidobacteriota bacterium]|nr:type II secretion system protein [Acidobacteriota bacterium]
MSYRKSPDRFLGKSHTSDDGFTLVELLVVTVIIPLVVGAIAVGLVAVFSLQSRTNQRLSYSGDLQMANATFVKDVQSAEYVTLSQSSARQCGTTGVQLLGLHWSGGLTAVTYALVPVDNGTTGVSLERFYCTLGTSTTPASSLIVAPDFAPSTLISDAQHTYLLPTVCVNGISSTDCVSTQTSYPNVSNIAAVQLPVYEPMSAAGYYTMTATPRSAFSTPGGNPNPLQLTPPFTLLFNNGGTTCTGSSTVLYVGNGSLTVNTNSGLGQLGVASPCANSVNYTNQAAINASTILTANPGGTSILSNQPKTPPPSTSFFSGFSDPLASTMSKFSPSSPPTTKGSCTLDKKKSIMQCTAGYYDISNSPISNTGGAPTISNGDTVCFTGQDASGADTTWFAT